MISVNSVESSLISKVARGSTLISWCTGAIAEEGVVRISSTVVRVGRLLRRSANAKSILLAVYVGIYCSHVLSSLDICYNM